MDTDDEIAFREWAKVRLAALLQFAFAVTHDEGGAEALVASALTRTLLAWPEVLVHGDPEHYARRMIVNEQVRLHRRRRRRRAVDTAPREHHSFVAAAPGDAALMERDRVWRELVNLPPRQRAVLVLRFYEARSEHEVANVLALPVDTVRRETRAAAATLRAGQSPTRLVHA